MVEVLLQEEGKEGLGYFGEVFFHKQYLSVQILRFWTLAIVLIVCLKHRPVFIQKHNVSKTGFCLRLQVTPTQIGPIDRASPYLRTPIPNFGKENISCC
jgi:hypothetical protein